MPFKNRIRLPFKLHKPQFPESAQRYRKANGVTVTLSVVVRKVYEGLTDSLPEKIHERLKIALVHDNVQVEGDKYVGVIAQDGDYQIEWQDFLSHPLAQGKFKAEVTPFNATNSNCGSCQEFTQVVANDDNFGLLNEGASYDLYPLSNDSICCNPVTLSIVSINSDYVNNLVVHPDNRVSFDIKSPVQEANNVILFTYKAECANGQYDQANVTANIDGSIPACLAPTGLTTVNVTATTASFDWDEVFGVLGFTWAIYKITDLVNPVQSGTLNVSEVTIGSLEPSQAYRFFVRTDCVGGGSSNFIYTDITTDAVDNEFCGRYKLTSDIPVARATIYIDCNGNEQLIMVPPFAVREICAMQTSPGVPVDIHGSSVVEYLGLC